MRHCLEKVAGSIQDAILKMQPLRRQTAVSYTHLDAYFERTVMTQIKAGIDKLGVASAREDRVFIQSRITKQYLDQYNQTYSVA